VLVRNQKGSILLVVLSVTLCLLLLGSALVALGYSDLKQSVRQQKNAEAVYIARGATEAVASYLLAHPEEVPQILTKGYDEVVLENGAKFKVNISKDGEGKVLISSTGYSGKNFEKLSFSLEPRTEIIYPEAEVFFPIFDMAVFAEGSITIGNSGIIDGNLGTHTVLDDDVYLNNSSEVDGNIQVGIGANPNQVVKLKNSAQVFGIITNLDEERHYPMPIFPEFPSLPNRGNINSSSTVTISESGSYGDIKIKNSGKLIFNVGSGTMKIRAKNFSLSNSSNVEINGSGKLILYIEDTVEFKNSCHFNVNTGDPTKALLYYKGASSKLKINNSCSFCGAIYAEKADFDLANSGEILGSIFTGGTDVKLSNSSSARVQVIYAPNALVTLHNSGYVKGAVVCKEFESKNSSTLEFSTEVQGIWELLPDLQFEPQEPEPIEITNYIKGSWSN
jgi:hypothetical protein